MGLLGNILGFAAGKSYEELAIERIAGPLGMTDTGIAFTPAMKERLARGHTNGAPTSNWDIPTLAGAGALRSTMADMIRFVQANLGLIESPLLGAMETTHAPRAEAGSPAMHIGLGWHILTAPSGRDIVWHNGGTGGYRAFAGFCSVTKTGVVVLTNSGEGPSDDMGFHLLDASLPMADIRAHAEIELSGDVLERYVGQYDMKPAGTLTIALGARRLFAQLTGQPKLPIFPESETSFFYKAVDATLVFAVDDSGAATGVTLHQGGTTLNAKKME